MRTRISKHFSDRAPSGFPGVSCLIQDALFTTSVAARAVSHESERVKRDTKSIGDRSEAIVLAELVKRGYLVSIPFGENQRYDLIIDDGTRLSRVQVKTGRLRGGVIVYNCSSSHAHRGGAARPYFREIEYLAVYCPDTEKVYMLPEQELTATSAHLRLSPTRNNMVKTIRWASEFELP
jgi:PD-(D/E)XK endonuclease